MEFEYDQHKSKINKEKHDVDFERTKNIWLVDHVIVPALTKDEPRFMIIGRIGPQIYSCIFTVRGQRMRIISCRKSRMNERKIYHEKIG